jgi:uncharacterized membrane protein HdeD (DUF308 family)
VALAVDPASNTTYRRRSMTQGDHETQPVTATCGEPPTSIVAIRAVAAVVGGIVLLAWPAPTLLVFSRGAGWAMGTLGLLDAIEQFSRRRVAWWAVVKALGIAALGVILLLWPGRTLLVATVLVGAWLIADGGSRLLGSMWEESPGAEVVANLVGIVEAVFGILVMARPVEGARAATVFAGLGLIVHGLGAAWDMLRRRRPATNA